MDFSCQVNDDSEADQSKFEDIIELPPCEIGKLGAIADAVTHSLQTGIQRQNIALAIEQEGYIPKLLELFHMCEDVENVEGLHLLYDTFKALFLLNQPALLSIMLQEDTIMDVIGCLEWDPSKPEPVKHREYVQSKVTFHEVIPIQSPELVAKIHLLYKVLYIQEVILPTPSVFEENVMAALKSFIQFAKTDIVSGLQVRQALWQSCLHMHGAVVLQSASATEHVTPGIYIHMWNIRTTIGLAQQYWWLFLI